MGVYGGFVEAFPELYRRYAVGGHDVWLVMMDDSMAGLERKRATSSDKFIDLSDHQLAFVPDAYGDYVHEGDTFINEYDGGYTMKFVKRTGYSMAAGYTHWIVERVQGEQEGKLEVADGRFD